MVSTDYEATVKLNLKEVQTLTAAMAGEFPDTLAGYRWEVLTKLAQAKHEIELPDARFAARQRAR